MTVDYDAPRPRPAGDTDDGLAALTIRRSVGQDGAVDVDDTTETFRSSDLDFADEELAVPVIPMRSDEFRCERCFLVHHRNQLADRSVADRTGVRLCRECA